MNMIGRRKFLQAATAVALPTAIIGAGETGRAVASTGSYDNFRNSIANQIKREATWAFLRSFYHAKDTGDATGFLQHFAISAQDVYQDATLGLGYSGYAAIAAAFEAFIPGVNAALGAGRFSKIFHVTGDMGYGGVAEYVDLKNTFYGTNGITIQTVFDFDGGLIARDTDYWDSRELGQSDIAGPAVTAGVAAPLGAVHAGGVARKAPAPAPPGTVSLATGVTGRPSASREMVQFTTDFHNALSYGSADDISRFFTEDATYVNPLIHQGPVLYGNFNQTIQVRGRDLIAALLRATVGLLPDCRASRTHSHRRQPSRRRFRMESRRPV